MQTITGKNHKLAKTGKNKSKKLLSYQRPASSLRLKITKEIRNDTIKTFEENTSLEAQTITKILLESAKFKLHKLSKTILSLNPYDISILTKVCSGHNNLNYHLKKSSLSDTEYCDFCNEPDDLYHKKSSYQETAAHILHNCPAFSRIRNEIFQNFYTTPKTWRYTKNHKEYHSLF